MSAGTAVLDRFARTGYDLVLEDGKIRASGPNAPSEDLRALVEANRMGLKAALLLADPPEWLEKLFKMWWDGTQTPVTRSAPTGKAETYMVRVTVREIAAATAAAVGMDSLRWEEIREEVEEALARFEYGVRPG
jgi:hypothetical protein